jgi:hypothetical protein
MDPHFPVVTADNRRRERRLALRTQATRDREAIRSWARLHDAEPATGEATTSGPSIVDVNDGGAGIRFNFPGFGRFRPISWDEWFDHFDRYHLMFVYADEPAEIASRAYELWERRGGAEGHDRDDWFRAEKEIRASQDAGPSPGPRYRLVKDDEADS